MKFIFVDEIECPEKSPNFYGLGAAIFNYTTYHKYKESFVSEFKKLKWNSEIEFKGKYLFSQGGDSSVSIDDRINFVDAIAKETNAKSNARIQFIFCYNQRGNGDKNYLCLLRNIVKAIKPGVSGYKKLMAYFLDDNKKIKREDIVQCINENSKGIVFERPFFVDSDNNTTGITTVDILTYLKSWVVLNPKQDDQLKLFDKSGEKIQVVKEILTNIKNIQDVKS